MKIGKGGQIYSIQVPGLGELIAVQRVQQGQWIDEVLQHTLPMPPEKSPKNDVVDGDVHQAGYYVTSDLDPSKQLIPRSVYSPIFNYVFDAASNSVKYVTWPQHAHLPRVYADNLLLINQTIRDLGDGVVEISVEVDKWGGVKNPSISIPFAGFRASTLPVHIISHPDGSFRVSTQHYRERIVRRLYLKDTGGWMAFAEGADLSARGIGIVFGKEPRPLDSKNSYAHWGNYNWPTAKAVGGTVAVSKRDIDLAAGEALYARYYLVFGTLAHIQAKSNQLEANVEVRKIDLTKRTPALSSVCLRGHEYRRPCEAGEPVVFHTYREFVAGGRPLFMLKDRQSGAAIVTDDPYELSFDPTDQQVEYVDFLGWSTPDSGPNTRCPYETLGVRMKNSSSEVSPGKTAGTLMVIPPAFANCMQNRS